MPVYMPFLVVLHRLRSWVVIAIVGLVLMSMETFGLLQVITHIGDMIFVRTHAGINMILKTAQQPLIIFQSKYEQQTKLRDLEQRYAESLAQLSKLEQVQKENEQLKQLVSSVETDTTAVMITQFFGSFAQPVIAGGSTNGIHEGALVTWSGQLLGIIGTVRPEQSQVHILTSPQAPPIVVRTQAGQQGIIEGNGTNIQLSHIPATEIIELGQRVVTVGQPGIPPGLLVGVMAQIVSDPTSPVHTIIVEQPITIYELDLVEVR